MGGELKVTGDLRSQTFLNCPGVHSIEAAVEPQSECVRVGGLTVHVQVRDPMSKFVSRKAQSRSNAPPRPEINAPKRIHKCFLTRRCTQSG